MKKAAHKKIGRNLFFYSTLLAISISIASGSYYLVKQWPKLSKYTRHTTNKFAGNEIIPNNPTPITKQPPVRIRIPKLNKELPIQAAILRNNEWEVFDNAIAWLSSSEVPGEGNVILYGHNRKSLLGDLYLLEVNDTIQIMQANVWKTYRVFESRAVEATDVQSVVSQNNQLTIYTCEGSFDQKRRVVYAVPL